MDKITSIIRADAQGIISRVNLSPLEGKTVVVTGATGIIGTYVMAVLDTWGKCGLVYPVSSAYPNHGTAAYEFCVGHAPLRIDLSKQTEDYIIPPHDFCFYGAGYGQPGKFTAEPLKTLAINTVGLDMALRSLTKGGRLLFASTSELYSGCSKPPFHENDIGNTTPQHPRGCYIEAKRCGEAICHAYNQTVPQNHAVAARIALAYGPGTRPDDQRALNQFIRRAIQDRKITLQDAGQVIRTYCYISDAVEMLLNIWLHGRFPVYNVGGKSKVTIARLARLIGELSGGVEVSVPPTTSNAWGDAPDNVSIDTRLVEGEFPKSSWVDLDEGLKRTIAWQRILYGQV